MIKIRVTPTQSEQIQKIAIEKFDYCWSSIYSIDDKRIVKNTHNPFLYLQMGNFRTSDNEYLFNTSGLEEVDDDYFINKHTIKKEEKMFGDDEDFRKLILEIIDNDSNNITVNEHMRLSKIAYLCKNEKQKARILAIRDSLVADKRLGCNTKEERLNEIYSFLEDK